MRKEGRQLGSIDAWKKKQYLSVFRELFLMFVQQQAVDYFGGLHYSSDTATTVTS
jgi:hypothetical protein